MSDALAALGRHGDAARAATQALEILAPFVERYPQSYEGLARTIGGDVLIYSEAAGVEPDRALLARVARVLGHGGTEEAEEDPEILDLTAKITAIVEAANLSGTLDETALAELPAELADRLRQAWAERGS